MTTAKFSRILTPYNATAQSGTPSGSNHAIDASNEGVAWVFDARTTNAITHLGFRYGARTGDPPVYIIGLEGVDSATGFPDGTYLGGGSPASGTFDPPADTTWNSTWQWVSLTNSYTPALGERLCITIRASGTPDGSNNSSFTTNWSQLSPVISILPYAIRNTTGTWASQLTAPCFGVRTASERYGAIVPNIYSTRSASTVGHRVAAKVNLPAGFGSTYKVAGIRCTASISNAVGGKNPLCKIWSASAALASKTLDTDVLSTSTGLYRTIETYFDTSVALSFGTDYYFGFEVADAVNAGIILYGIEYASADDIATDEGGNYIHHATYDGSNWSDVTTVRPMMELILEDWTEPSGGSGAIVGPFLKSGSGRAANY